MLRHTLVFLFTIAFSSATHADSESQKQNWPQWRGPTSTGVAADGDYPLEFSATENVVWKVKLPGRGSSTPAIWGDQIFVTTPIDGKDGVICYNFAGKEQWKQSFGEEVPGKHRNGSGSNPSPVTDGKHLVTYYKSGTLACLDLTGNVKWRTNLQSKYGKDNLWWDLGSSPVIAANNAVVAVMQGKQDREEQTPGQSYLVAIGLDDGEVAWKQQRQYDRPKESDQSYTTPRVLNLDGREVIVTWGADFLTGNDATSGELLWECGGFNPDDKGFWRVIASPAVDEQVAVVPYGRGDLLAAVNMNTASGDITATHRLWEKVEIGSDVPTPIIQGNQVILLGDKGKVHCLNKKTGEEIWAGRLPKAKAKYYSSPILAGNKLYCAREDGTIMSCTIDGGLQNVHENDMEESVIATPIPLRDKLLVRGETHLFLLGR